MRGTTAMNKVFLIFLLTVGTSGATENELEISPNGAFDQIVINKVNDLIKEIQNNPILQLLNNLNQEELDLGVAKLTNVKFKDILGFKHSVNNISVKMEPGKGICGNLTLEVLWQDTQIASDFLLTPSEILNGGRADLSGGIDVTIKNSGITADIVLEGMMPKKVSAVLIINDVKFAKLEFLGQDLEDTVNLLLKTNKEDLCDILNYLLNDIIKVVLGIGSLSAKTFSEATTFADVKGIIESNKDNIKDWFESLV